MLRVVSFTGEHIFEAGPEDAEILATESLAPFIKRQVQKKRNVSIFCQRLLHHDHIITDGDMWQDLGRPQEIQIMFAHYVNDYADQLLGAASAGNEEVAREVLCQLQDPNCLDSQKESPLWKACAAGHVSLAQLLHSADADLESRDVHGKTPLAAAAANNHLEVTHCLVHAGSDVNALDYERLSPLLWATQNGHLQVMRSLIDAKADKDAANDRQETPLFLVASNGYATAVRVLTEAGADKEKADECNYTPLHIAAENGHLEAVHVLIEAGASINSCTRSGATPLFVSAKRGHLKVVSLWWNLGRRKTSLPWRVSLLSLLQPSLLVLRWHDSWFRLELIGAADQALTSTFKLFGPVTFDQC